MVSKMPRPALCIAAVGSEPKEGNQKANSLALPVGLGRVALFFQATDLCKDPNLETGTCQGSKPQSPEMGDPINKCVGGF